ncbi:co-chaperone GroES [Marinifilum breve]|uniref:10 kDa chaperonin n=1 Tax=Marinifilum breve TaxID=2184082 RepID=A0A2V3ZRX2_9BACT|nr:co-chaperone GroES [Marinifilum breve]PXX96951.1 co-chaperone GroES [Marinifilum breve]
MAELKGKILAGKVLVKPIIEEKTASGIIIPSSRKDDAFRGEVVLVGSALPDVPMEVSVGDIVVYEKKFVPELTIEGEEYLLLSQDNVLYIE